MLTAHSLVAHVSWRSFCRAAAVSLALIWADLSLAQAPAQTLPPDMRCSIAVRDTLAIWETTGEMFRDATGPFGDRTWRLATRRLGTWVALSVDPWALPTLTRIDEHGTTRIRFEPSCTLTRSHERALPIDPPADTFSDDDLAALVSDGTPGVIYVWSPHMPLSVDAYHQVVQASEDLGVTMTALLDPGVDPGYAKTVAGSSAIPKGALRPFRSVDLRFRNATMHAPSLLVYARGRMLGLAVPGYRDAAGYRTTIENRIGELSSLTDR